jgi:hypothetical protein
LDSYCSGKQALHTSFISLFPLSCARQQIGIGTCSARAPHSNSACQHGRPPHCDTRGRGGRAGPSDSCWAGPLKTAWPPGMAGSSVETTHTWRQHTHKTTKMI